MDDCLPLESLSAASLRMLLARECAFRQDLEQEVTRLQAGLARQNALIMHLQQRDAMREQEAGVSRMLVAGLTEQNGLLRQQLARLEQAQAQERGEPLGRPPAPLPTPRPAPPTREKKTRTKRDSSHNRGRHRLEQATRWETYAVEQCPECGEPLGGGWVARRVKVIDLPPLAPLEITEHRIIRRQCTRCGKRVLPPPVGQGAGRQGQCRFGPRLIAAITVMATREHLPVRMIQERLQWEYGVTISLGGIMGLLYRMVRAGTPTYRQLQADVRASAVVHADETGWRETGQHTTIWTVSTAHTVYVHHGRLTSEEIDGILGADYGGTIVADWYAAYDHFLGPKQRCWAHLVRNLDELLGVHGANTDTVPGSMECLRSMRRHASPVHRQRRAGRPRRSVRGSNGHSSVSD